MTEDLSSKQSWSQVWKTEGVTGCGELQFKRAGFHRDLDDLIKQHIQPSIAVRFLELGCFPGRFMRYFANRFQSDVFGLEYMVGGASQTRSNLAQLGIEATVYQGDFRTFEPKQPFDIVSSFGLIEHFSDSAEVISHHLRLLSPGGHVLITFPLHDGFYGKAMKRVAPDRYAQHNQMSLEDAVSAASSISNCDIVAAQAVGRFGFEASRVDVWLRGLFPGSGWLLYKPFRVLDRILKWALPNTRRLAPFAVIILQRSEQEE